MHWVIIPLTVLVGWFTADLVASVALRFLCWLPYPWMRRWAIILPGFFIGVPLFALFVTSLFLALEDWLGVAGLIVFSYRDVPTLTIWTAAFFVPFTLGLAIIGLRGLWPLPDVPYLPRAAEWSLTKRSKKVAWSLGLLGVLLIAQDFELQRGLNNLASTAKATAESMRPTTVDQSQNAAVHYQEILALHEQFTAEEGSYWEQPDHNPQDEEALEYMDRLKPLVAQFHLAAEREGCCFADEYQPLHIIDGMDTNFGLIAAVRRLCWNAHFAIEQGRQAEAVRCVTAIRQLQRHLQIDRRNVKSVFFFWYESWIRQILEHLSATDHNLPEEVLEELQAPPIKWEEVFEEAWRWHGAEVQQHMADLFLGHAIDDMLPDHIGGEDADWRAKVAVALGTATNRLLYARDDISATHKYCRLSDYGLDEQSWLDYEEGKLNPNGRYLGDLWDTAVYPNWVQRGNDCRKLSNFAIAAMLYRRENGQWPPSPAELVPEQTETDEPLLTMHYRDGLLVYSADLDEYVQQHQDTDEWWRELEERAFAHDLLRLGEAYTRIKQAEDRSE